MLRYLKFKVSFALLFSVKDVEFCALNLRIYFLPLAKCIRLYLVRKYLLVLTLFELLFSITFSTFSVCSKDQACLKEALTAANWLAKLIPESRSMMIRGVNECTYLAK